MTDAPNSLAAIPLTRQNGASDSLANYAGKVVLIVNVASKCGLTPQYAGLEALYKAHADDGLVILGFPANDFGAQEPGTDEEIAEFCALNYGVSFPLFTKADVTGPETQPLFGALTAAMPQKTGDTEPFRDRLRAAGMTPTQDPEVLWNFEKFLIGRDGNVKARFAPTVAPDAPELLAAINVELAK